jgi:hypothetical protein
MGIDWFAVTRTILARQSPAVLVNAQIDAMGEYPVPLLLSTMAYAGDQYPPPTTYTHGD